MAEFGLLITIILFCSINWIKGDDRLVFKGDHYFREVTKCLKRVCCCSGKGKRLVIYLLKIVTKINPEIVRVHVKCIPDMHSCILCMHVIFNHKSNKLILLCRHYCIDCIIINGVL